MNSEIPDNRHESDLGAYLSTLSDQERREIDAAGFAIDMSILLHRARKRRGLSQAELARRLGRSQQAVSQIERPGANPTIETIALYLNALGCGIQFTLTDASTNEVIDYVTAPQAEHDDDDELSNEDMRRVLEGEAQIRRGDFVTLEEMRRRQAG